jgi:hypothetical protein
MSFHMWDWCQTVESQSVKSHILLLDLQRVFEYFETNFDFSPLNGYNYYALYFSLKLFDHITHIWIAPFFFSFSRLGDLWENYWKGKGRIKVQLSLSLNLREFEGI